MATLTSLHSLVASVCFRDRHPTPADLPSSRNSGTDSAG